MKCFTVPLVWLWLLRGLAAGEPPRLMLGSGGFVDDWVVLGPLVSSKPSDREQRRVEQALLKGTALRAFQKPITAKRGTTLSWRLQEGHLGWTPLEKVESRRKHAVKYHAVVLDSPRDCRLQLKIGTDGELVAWLDGSRILKLTKEFGMLEDDRILPLELAQGRHVLVVKVVWQRKNRNRRPFFAVRLHDMSNRAPRSLTVLLPRAGALHPRRHVRTQLETRPRSGGYDVRAELSSPGTLPRDMGVWEPRLVPEGRVEAAPFDASLLGHKKVTLEGRVEPNRSKSLELKLSLVDGDGKERLATTKAVIFDSALHEKLGRARKNLQAARQREVPEASLHSLQYQLERLERLIGEQEPDRTYLRQQTNMALRLSEALMEGQDPYPALRGVFTRAYRSRLDGRLQHYALLVPQSYRPQRKRPYPLLVALKGQGSTPRMMMRRVHGFDIQKGETREQARRYLPELPDRGMLVVCPHSYRDTGNRYFGGLDLFRVLQEVTRDYHVDPRRIYLTGLSMGGLGTFHMGLRYPDRFAALVTMAGYSSVRLYSEFWGVRFRPWERSLLDRRDDALYALNGKYLPLWSVHGRYDRPQHSEAMVKGYENFGYTVKFDVLPRGHNVWGEGYKEQAVFEYFKGKRRPQRPNRVVFTTMCYRHRRAYWVELNDFADLRRFATVRASIVGRKRQLVRVRTRNLLGLTLYLNETRIKGSGTKQIVIDGQSVLEFTEPAPFHFRRQGRKWLAAETSLPEPGAKRPGLSGPIEDIRYEPHLFVYGTLDEAQAPINKERAEQDARYSILLARVRFPVKADTEVTDADIRSQHLVLYGGPQSNLIVRSIADRLPIRIGTSAVAVGQRTYQGPDVGVQLIYPNPSNPQKYVLIKAGTTWLGTHYSRYLPRWLPDYIVYDRRVTVQIGNRVMDKRPALEAGYFDRHWKLPARGNYWTGR